MTTVAMVAGMFPVAAGWGGDADFRSPMAIAVIGGFITLTMLTLVIVPAVFTLFDDIERWMAPKAARLLAQPAGTPAGPASPGHPAAFEGSASDWRFDARLCPPPRRPRTCAIP